MLDILPTGAYNKGNESEESIGLTNKARSPSVFAVPRGFLFAMGSVLAAAELFVKPLADIVSHYTCCDGQNESENCVHWPHLLSMEWAGVKRRLQDIIDSDKKQFYISARFFTFLQNFSRSFYPGFSSLWFLRCRGNGTIKPFPNEWIRAREGFQKRGILV